LLEEELDSTDSDGGSGTGVVLDIAEIEEVVTEFLL
jgi:hypothetical protein